VAQDEASRIMQEHQQRIQQLEAQRIQNKIRRAENREAAVERQEDECLSQQAEWFQRRKRLRLKLLA